MKYPIGIQSFSDIIEGSFVYVDKTQYVYELASDSKYYFLSRPRRFGKSLFLSTLEAYFLGQKELFKGLAIESLEKDWTAYPVLKIDLNAENYLEEGALDDRLNKILSRFEKIYGRNPEEKRFPARFESVIENAYEKTGKKVVVLVDEYDKPLIENIADPERQAKLRATLKGFYSVLKAQDQHIRFAFLTGVTKFSHVSIFSDLNQLEDISMLPQYASICGISEKEIHQYFEESINNLAQNNNYSFQECSDKLKERYDGYHFYLPSEGMYNPFSLLHTFKNGIFNDYWFASGTPTFLAELLRNFDCNLELLETDLVSVDFIGDVDSFEENPLPILYQSGYLTIKDYDPHLKSYVLKFPNKEVEEGFINFLIPYFTKISRVKKMTILGQFLKDVENGDADSFLQTLKVFFDDTDYRIAGDKEIYFQNSMYLIFKLLGFYVEVERCTSQGRIDIVLGTKDYLYVMELKVSATAQEAIRQIDEKGYMLPFKQDHRKLVKIGVAFDLDTRTLTEWQIKEL